MSLPASFVQHDAAMVSPIHLDAEANRPNHELGVLPLEENAPQNA